MFKTKTVLILIISLLAVSVGGKAQTTTDNFSTERKVSLYFVIESNGSKPLTTRDLLMGRSEGEQRILNKDSIKQFYPNIKADYILIVKLKPGVRLLNITQLFDKFKIEKQHRSFLVLWDGTETEDVKTLLASDDYITQLAVDEKKKRINIITKDYDKVLDYRRRAAKSKAELLRKQKNNEKF